MDKQVSLRVLHIEDSEDDAMLVAAALRRAGYAPQARRVETGAALQQALHEAEWDLVIADYSLPQFSAPAALESLRTAGLDLPLIIVSGTIREEEAVTALRAGAKDFITKGNLARLGPAVARELQETADRRQVQQAQRLLDETEERFQQVWDTTSDAMAITDPRGLILAANPAYFDLYGTTPEQTIGQSFAVAFPEAQRADLISQYAQVFTSPERPGTLEAVICRPDGAERAIESRATFLTTAGRRTAMLSTIRNVTERKRQETLRQVLLEIMQAAAVTDDLPGFFRLVHQAIARVLDATNFFITLHNPATGLFEEAYSVDQFDPPAPPSRLEKSISAHVFRSGQPLLLSQARFEELVAQGEVALVGTNSPSWLGAPLTTAGGPIGVMVVQNYEYEHRYSEHDRQLLASVAGQVALVVQRKQAEDQIRRQLDQLQALRAIDLAITSSLDVNLTLNVFLEQVQVQLGVDAAAVLMLNPVTHMLSFAAGRGFRDPAVTKVPVKLGEGRAGRVALAQRAIIEHEPPPAPSARTGKLVLDRFVSYFGLPLAAKGQLLGVLELFHRSRLEPDPAWLSFLEALAGQAAIAIENATLFDGLQRSHQELGAAYDATIEGWSRALDLRDKETEGHSRRVTELTLQLAQAAGIGPDELVHIRRGALLHDIGKMGVPDHILLKPEPLTADEWEIMRLHPRLAYDLLSPIAFLRPALDIPYCHHERWDGTGYPRGLAGEQIPLAARLFAVVDVWDALRADRPYRPAWTSAQAIAHIRAAAGSHFDPAVVAPFLRMVC